MYFEAHAGMSPECYNSPGQGNVGVCIDFMHGHHIGADVLPGPIGRLSPEYVLARDPDVYIATGVPTFASINRDFLAIPVEGTHWVTLPSS